MGTYIYTLMKSAPRPTSSGPVYRYKFSERLAYGEVWNGKRYVDVGMAQRAREERHAERWEGYVESGMVTGHTLVCIEGNEWDGVYRQDVPVAVWSDCDSIQGQFVGYLARKGRGWNVRSLESALMDDRSILDSYLTTHSLWPKVGEVVGEIRDQVMAHYKVAYAHWKAPHFRSNCLHWPSTGTEEYAVGQRLEQCLVHVRQPRERARTLTSVVLIGGRRVAGG